MSIEQDPYEEMRRKPLRILNKHAERRVEDNASLEAVVEAMRHGDISPEGRGKYRAVLPVKDGKLLVVIFRDWGEYLILLTVTLTGGSRRWRPWG
ncbi:MAG: hypothetical protein QF415_13725 [Candidatus Undinarchaeales archaeon]|jgi:hypothetical protein|nr:hypothetical protein [Candidatus Undinarchaeales archaeon]MDP7493935.1 hypothetical protein [Candidatus Undinarchaeales archaeon]